MTYIRVVWKHSFEDQPILLFSELDDDRWETRKVEVFRDGRVAYADGKSEFGGAVLGEKRVPPQSEIASDPQFLPSEITRDDFEIIWAQKTGFIDPNHP
jgi:hypothetical protein